MLSIIVAMTPQGVIGNQNSLPWHMPSDLRRFRQTTINHSVVMGRKTFESIITRNGKPLEGRTNFVFTHNHEKIRAHGGVSVSSIEEVCGHESASDEIFIIGGANVYEQFISVARRLYITIIKANIEGDTKFPEINFNNWELKESTPSQQELEDEYISYFAIYQRVKN